MSWIQSSFLFFFPSFFLSFLIFFLCFSPFFLSFSPFFHSFFLSVIYLLSFFLPAILSLSLSFLLSVQCVSVSSFYWNIQLFSNISSNLSLLSAACCLHMINSHMNERQRGKHEWAFWGSNSGNQTIPTYLWLQNKKVCRIIFSFLGHTVWGIRKSRHSGTHHQILQAIVPIGVDIYQDFVSFSKGPFTWSKRDTNMWPSCK